MKANGPFQLSNQHSFICSLFLVFHKEAEGTKCATRYTKKFVSLIIKDVGSIV